MCSQNDDPTTYDAPVPQRPRVYELSGSATHGRLDLQSSWARQAISSSQRRDIETLIPAGVTLGVLSTPRRAAWVLWLSQPGYPTTTRLRVSGVLPLVEACRWALTEHWAIA